MPVEEIQLQLQFYRDSLRLRPATYTDLVFASPDFLIFVLHCTYYVLLFLNICLMHVLVDARSGPL
jgi:hypothetical protein